MYKYINVIDVSYKEGIKSALNDYESNKIKNFKNINEIEILSKIYDFFYIKGYRDMYKILKNKSLN